MYAKSVRDHLLPWPLAALVALLASGCWATATVPPSPICERLATPKACPIDPNTDPPEQLAKRRQSAIQIRQEVPIMTGSCPREVAIAMASNYDACIASFDAVLPQAIAEAEARRRAAGPAVASLRADARYAPARESYRKRVILQSAACNSSNAGPDKGCEFASSDVREAQAAMRSLFAEHHIDLRDADALGVW